MENWKFPSVYIGSVKTMVADEVNQGGYAERIKEMTKGWGSPVLKDVTKARHLKEATQRVQIHLNLAFSYVSGVLGLYLLYMDSHTSRGGDMQKDWNFKLKN